MNCISNIPTVLSIARWGEKNINKKGGLCAWHWCWLGWWRDRSMFWGEGVQGVRAEVATMTHRTPASHPVLFVSNPNLGDCMTRNYNKIELMLNTNLITLLIRSHTHTVSFVKDLYTVRYFKYRNITSIFSPYQVTAFAYLIFSS